MEALAESDFARVLSLAFRDNRQAMYALARRICGEDSASDVVQEVFLRAWRTAYFDSQRGSMKSYLMTLTRGVAIDMLRQRSAAERRDNSQGRVEASTRVQPDEALLAEEVRAQVTAAVADLRPHEQTVIVAAFFHGLTYREVAIRYGLAEGTVKSRIRLAMVKLRKQLGEEVLPLESNR